MRLILVGFMGNNVLPVRLGEVLRARHTAARTGEASPAAALGSGAAERMLDGLILACAVLLFAVMSMVMTDVLPTWLITIPLAIAVAAIFGAIYWFLFAFWFSSTPGEHLARMACLESADGMYREPEHQTRFR